MGPIFSSCIGDVGDPATTSMELVVEVEALWAIMASVTQTSCLRVQRTMQ